MSISQECKPMAGTLGTLEAEEAGRAFKMPRLNQVDAEADYAADRLFSIAAESNVNVHMMAAQYLRDPDGELPDAFVNAATASGIPDPHRMIAFVFDGFAKIGDSILSTNGVEDVAGCKEWICKHATPEERVRISMQLLHDDPSGFQTLAQQYLQAVHEPHCRDLDCR